MVEEVVGGRAKDEEGEDEWEDEPQEGCVEGILRRESCRCQHSWLSCKGRTDNHM